MTQDDDLFTNLINNNKNTKTCCGCHLIPNSPELLDYFHIPEWYKYNSHIVYGHRPTSNFKLTLVFFNTQLNI